MRVDMDSTIKPAPPLDGTTVLAPYHRAILEAEQTRKKLNGWDKTRKENVANKLLMALSTSDPASLQESCTTLNLVQSLWAHWKKTHLESLLEYAARTNTHTKSYLWDAFILSHMGYLCLT